MPTSRVRLSPRRVATGTATRPTTAKNRPGIAVMTPAMDPPEPKAASASPRTGAREEIPARRLIAARKTAMNARAAGMTARLFTVRSGPCQAWTGAQDGPVSASSGSSFWMSGLGLARVVPGTTSIRFHAACWVV